MRIDTELEKKLSRYVYVLGADCNLCCRKLGIDAETFRAALRRFQRRGRKTLRVRPTEAGDNRYFVLYQDSNGNRSLECVPFNRLTAEEKAMVAA